MDGASSMCTLYMQYVHQEHQYVQQEHLVCVIRRILSTRFNFGMTRPFFEGGKSLKGCACGEPCRRILVGGGGAGGVRMREVARMCLGARMTDSLRQ